MLFEALMDHPNYHLPNKTQTKILIMMHSFLKMLSLKLSLFVGMIFLAACSPDGIQEELQSGFYLPSKVIVQFPSNDTPFAESDNVEKARLTEEITALFNQSYFQITPGKIQYVDPMVNSEGIITPEQLIMTNIATFEIVVVTSDKVVLRSLDHDICPISGCQITLQLLPVSDDDPALIERMTTLQHLEKSDLSSTPFSRSSAEISQIIQTPQWGIIHNITEMLFLKLSPTQSNGLMYGYPTHSIIPPFTVGNLSIDPADPDVEVLSFYSDRAPSQEKNGIQTISYLFIIPVQEAPQLSLDQLDRLNPRAYSSDNGYIAEDQGGFYAVNYRYFPTMAQAVIGLTEGVTLDAVIDHFAAIDHVTPTPTDFTEKVITLDDIKLHLTTLEARYGITLDEMFAKTAILQQYQTQLSEWLKSSAILIGDAPSVDNGYHTFIRNSFNYHFPELKIKLHTSSVKEILHSLQNNISDQTTAHNAQTLWQDPIFIYNTDPYMASGLSYFKEIQAGITLEIFSNPYQGHTAEKVLFGKLLSQLDLSQLPKIPQEMIPNIGRYSVDQDTAINQPLSTKGQYQFKEGMTDRYGRLLN